MRTILITLFALASVGAAMAFPVSVMVFQSDSEALTFVEAIESRWPHQPGWSYCDHASPTIHLVDGRKALVIVDSARQYLTPEELAQVVEIDSSLIPPPPPLPW